MLACQVALWRPCQCGLGGVLISMSGLRMRWDFMCHPKAPYCSGTWLLQACTTGLRICKLCEQYVETLCRRLCLNIFAMQHFMTIRWCWIHIQIRLYLFGADVLSMISWLLTSIPSYDACFVFIQWPVSATSHRDTFCFKHCVWRLLQCCSRRSKVIVPVCMCTLYLCCWVFVHVFRRRKHTVKRECRQTQGHDCCWWHRCQEIFQRLPACSWFMQALSTHQSTKHCAGFLFCYVDVGTQQHHAFHHPPTPPSHTFQVRWSLLKLVGAVVML